MIKPYREEGRANMQKWQRVLEQLDADGSEWAQRSSTRESLVRSVEAALLARGGCGSVRTCERIVRSKARVATVIDQPAPPPYVAALATRRTIGWPCTSPMLG